MPGPIALQTDDARPPLWWKLLMAAPMAITLAALGFAMHNHFVLERTIDVLMTSNEVWSKLYYDLATKVPTEEEHATCL